MDTNERNSDTPCHLQGGCVNNAQKIENQMVENGTKVPENTLVSQG